MLRLIEVKLLLLRETQYWSGESRKTLPAFREEKDEEVEVKVGRQNLPFIRDLNITKRIPEISITRAYRSHSTVLAWQ